MDTDIENSMSIHINGTTTKFYSCNDGLYFHDPNKVQDNINSSNANKNKTTVISYSANIDNHLSLLNTVHKNKSVYNKKEIKSANESLNLL